MPVRFLLVMEGTRAASAWKSTQGVVAVVAATGVFAYLSGAVLSPSVAQITSDHLMTVLPFVAGVLSFFVAKNHAGRIRTAWILLGCWGLLSASGNALWSYYELVAKTDPFPSLADVGYLGGNLCAVTAMAMFAFGSRRASRVRTFLDAVIIAASVFLISWTLALEAVVNGSGGSVLEVAVGLAYPAIDVVIVSLVVFVASRTQGRMRVPLLILGVGFIGWAFADTGFAYLSIIDAYQSGGPIDAGWIGGDALIALATFMASRRRRFDQTEDVSVPWWRMHLPYFVAGAAVIVGSAGGVVGNAVEPIEAVAVFVLLLLAVARQFFMVLETQSITIERLRSVDEMKNGILRAVSHELRTPLTVIEGVAAVLAEGGLEPDEQADLVGRLLRNSARLKDFLSSLLDLERLTRGVLEPDRRSTEVTGVLRTTAENVGVDTHTIRVADTIVWANVDVAQIERIVENLFVNAQRHTPNGTRIDASVDRDDAGVTITVSDNGPGIPDEMKEQVFRPFAQDENSPGAGRGTGLGLALVENFASLHGGRAWVEDAHGGGASFKVFLSDPAGAVAERAVA